MSLWLLTYKNRHGRLHGLFIIEAASLLRARMVLQIAPLTRARRLPKARNLTPPGRRGFRPAMLA